MAGLTNTLWAIVYQGRYLTNQKLARLNESSPATNFSDSWLITSGRKSAQLLGTYPPYRATITTNFARVQFGTVGHATAEV